MSSISVTLIRSTHSDFCIDDIESLQVIRLNNKGIDLIDNLEVFSNIEELHLAGNKIKRIENIDFLSRLHLLDLSNNLITGESLNSSIGLLPQNIRTLILIGNPCTENKFVLNAVQQSYVSLKIVVDDAFAISDHQTELKIDNLKIDGIMNEDDKRGGDKEDVGGFPLNADEVLQSLVERKCRLQSLETLDITKTVEVRQKIQICAWNVLSLDSIAYLRILCPRMTTNSFVINMLSDDEFRVRFNATNRIRKAPR